MELYESVRQNEMHLTIWVYATEYMHSKYTFIEIILNITHTYNIKNEFC